MAFIEEWKENNCSFNEEAYGSRHGSWKEKKKHIKKERGKNRGWPCWLESLSTEINLLTEVGDKFVCLDATYMKILHLAEFIRSK